MVQAIGAPESEALNFGNPKKIDGDGAIALVEAAVAAGIDQYVMVTSLGTAKIGFPAGKQHPQRCPSTQRQNIDLCLLDEAELGTIPGHLWCR